MSKPVRVSLSREALEELLSGKVVKDMVPGPMGPTHVEFCLQDIGYLAIADIVVKLGKKDGQETDDLKSA